VKLYFANQRGSAQRTLLIQKQANACKYWLQAEKQTRADLNHSQSFDRAIHDFRIGQINAMLTWLSLVEDIEFDQNCDTDLRG
jgi:hypothetical protein